MNKIVDFEPEHLEYIDRAKLGICPDWKELGEIYKKFGPAFSAFANGDLIACAGVVILWRGVGEAWTIVTPGIYKYPKFFHGAVSTYLNMIIKDHNLVRVQASVRAGFDTGIRWIERLGFENEGLMKKFDYQQSDCWRYARVM